MSKKPKDKKKKIKKTALIFKKCHGGIVMVGDTPTKCHWRGKVDKKIQFCPACNKEL